MKKQLIEKDLITELGLGDLSDEKKMELVIKWGNIVQKDIMMRVLAELPEGDKEELDKLLIGKGENFEEIYQFLEKKLPNLDEIAKEEIEKFRKEMRETFKSLGFI
jgi:hypothetical protein